MRIHTSTPNDQTQLIPIVSSGKERAEPALSLVFSPFCNRPLTIGGNNWPEESCPPTPLSYRDLSFFSYFPKVLPKALSKVLPK